MNVALVTCERFRNLTQDDCLIIEALARRSITARAAVWTDNNVDWRAFDAAIVRSTWDYHLQPTAFGDWIDRVSLQTKLFNDSHLLRWNVHKRYLLELQKASVEIVPTVLIPKRSGFSLERFLEEIGTAEFVLKPAISASAHRTFVFGDGHTDISLAAGILETLAQDGDVLLQPFLREIYTHGERSAIFLAGEFSHAVWRPPLSTGAAGGEQRENCIMLSDAEMHFARSVLDRLPVVPVYARVDFLPLDSGRIVLTELELIEPALYFRHYPRSADMFAEAILHSAM